jgi:hypothetical protein
MRTVSGVFTNFLFDLENEAILHLSRLIATLQNELSIGAIAAVWSTVESCGCANRLQVVRTIFHQAR